MPKFSKMKLFVSAMGRFREFLKIFFVDLNRSNFLNMEVLFFANIPNCRVENDFEINLGVIGDQGVT